MRQKPYNEEWSFGMSFHPYSHWIVLHGEKKVKNRIKCNYLSAETKLVHLPLWLLQISGHLFWSHPPNHSKTMCKVNLLTPLISQDILPNNFHTSIVIGNWWYGRWQPPYDKFVISHNIFAKYCIHMICRHLPSTIFKF